MLHSKKIFLIAGEASGDLQAAALIRALKTQHLNLHFRGLGGSLMAAEGMELVHDLTKEAALGLGDVLRKYFTFRRIFYEALKEVQNYKPDVIILVDYPGFNLRFAKKINKAVPIIYYISPQIWAWGAKRIHAIRRYIDHLIVFFQFERELYEREQVPVTWVGHPLVDLAKPSRARGDLRTEFLPASPRAKLISLLPGSRESEVKRMLPEMLAVAALIHQKSPDVRFILSQSPTLPVSLYQSIVAQCKPTFMLSAIRNRSFDLLHASDFAMVSSGTATLEAALAATPFVIFYKTAQSTFFLGRHLIRIPYIGLVNVVAGRKIVPEFIQHEIHPETIAQEALYLLNHEDLKDKMIADLLQVRQKLGEPGAANRAADAVLKFLSFPRPLKYSEVRRVSPISVAEKRESNKLDPR